MLLSITTVKLAAVIFPPEATSYLSKPNPTTLPASSPLDGMSYELLLQVQLDEDAAD
jgi:hypothetical protein